ncbi:hypothetical protein GUITHDRAFT_136392 [Guillardia theta CCMP2712]|uniref:PDZ domain-containing protein n=1 Tax=Guillardia theta (strain CCMP2712) TaxID=905079 RepID=L1JK34_GUITC|nr:hypothetical protein GUITHDRAFT_136392 [Guillardia theta CCMP2712]EKX48697.1 hypothetical protein GUITHDRAFT_136392 [Guillardia theta CCMP2712]|eukprot:XP_005835677.1 hypothetical protein GUITHDRAFT_136392 [Guillardia theta CCMP2712]
MDRVGRRRREKVRIETRRYSPSYNGMPFVSSAPSTPPYYVQTGSFRSQYITHVSEPPNGYSFLSFQSAEESSVVDNFSPRYQFPLREVSSYEDSFLVLAEVMSALTEPSGKPVDILDEARHFEGELLPASRSASLDVSASPNLSLSSRLRMRGASGASAKALGSTLGICLEVGGSCPRRIQSLVPGGPAQTSGLLQAGDEIVSVDGIEVSDTSVMEVLRKPSPIASKCRICGTLCRSPAASTEHAQVNRRGKKLDVTLHRAHFGMVRGVRKLLEMVDMLETNLRLHGAHKIVGSSLAAIRSQILEMEKQRSSRDVSIMQTFKAKRVREMFIAEGIQMLQQWMLSEKLTREERCHAVCLRVHLNISRIQRCWPLKSLLMVEEENSCLKSDLIKARLYIEELEANDRMKLTGEARSLRDGKERMDGAGRKDLERSLEETKKEIEATLMEMARKEELKKLEINIAKEADEEKTKLTREEMRRMEEKLGAAERSEADMREKAKAAEEKAGRSQAEAEVEEGEREGGEGLREAGGQEARKDAERVREELRRAEEDKEKLRREVLAQNSTICSLEEEKRNGKVAEENLVTRCEVLASSNEEKSHHLNNIQSSCKLILQDFTSAMGEICKKRLMVFSR